MAIHLLPFYLATGSTTFPTTITGLTGDIIPINANTNYTYRNDLFVLAANCFGTNAKRSQISSPSINTVTPVQVFGVVTGATMVDTPSVSYFLSGPVRLPAVEEFKLQGNNSSGTTSLYGFMVVSDTVPVPQAAPGPYYVLHGSSTTTLSANTWTQLVMTWDQSISAKTEYYVVGMQSISSNGYLTRIWGPSQTFRPGCLAMSAFGQKSDPIFATPSLGNYFRFHPYSMPNVEHFSLGTEAQTDVFLIITPALS
jgi:hypothetical protein